MNPVRRHGTMTIFLSMVAALLLLVLPLPEWAQPFRPQWPALVLIYWSMALPQRVGVGSAWLLGFTADLLTESLLGLHALGFSLIAFIVLKLYRQIRVFPLWQQATGVLLLLLMERFLTTWIMGFVGEPPLSPLYWSAPLVGMLLWPWVFLVLRDARRRFHVN